MKTAQTIKPRKTQAGYSDFRLWPCYLLGTSVIFGLAPFVGMFFASVVGLSVMAGMVHWLVVRRPLQYERRQELYITFAELITHNRNMYYQLHVNIRSAAVGPQGFVNRQSSKPELL